MIKYMLAAIYRRVLSDRRCGVSLFHSTTELPAVRKVLGRAEGRGSSTKLFVRNTDFSTETVDCQSAYSTTLESVFFSFSIK